MSVCPLKTAHMSGVLPSCTGARSMGGVAVVGSEGQMQENAEEWAIPAPLSYVAHRSQTPTDPCTLSACPRLVRGVHVQIVVHEIRDDVKPPACSGHMQRPAALLVRVVGAVHARHPEEVGDGVAEAISGGPVHWGRSELCGSGVSGR